jgi:hypothetical protein
VDDTPTHRPPALPAILADSAARGFAMACEERTGSLLATLAASKPGGRLRTTTMSWASGLVVGVRV